MFLGCITLLWVSLMHCRYPRRKDSTTSFECDSCRIKRSTKDKLGTKGERSKRKSFYKVIEFSLRSFGYIVS